jgi:sugar phosphate isomerase/epimerase
MNTLSFSTLGCPAWDIDQIRTNALAFGYGAIELRGYLDQMDLTQAAPFTPQQRAQTRQQFHDAGLTFCCIGSSGVVAQGNLDHVKTHCELAQALGAPSVRVFGGKLPEESDTSHAEGIARFAVTLAQFGDAAQEAGVQIVLETHDSFSKGSEVAELLAATNHPAVFSLWDLHHPYRQGESIEDTHRCLAPTMRHVHIKDGIAGKYTLLGEGDVPVFAMLDLALRGGYTGPISLEWEKRWHPELPDPEIAFPQYATKLKKYLEKAVG